MKANKIYLERLRKNDFVNRFFVGIKFKSCKLNYDEIIGVNMKNDYSENYPKGDDSDFGPEFFTFKEDWTQKPIDPKWIIKD